MQRGVIFGVIAYGIWGLFPLYWPLLEPATPLEILAQRIVWSLVVSGLALLVIRQWSAFRTMSPRVWLLVVAAAVLIAVNWGIYIWAINSGHVVETSLGYFINPLLSVTLAVVFFKERLRPLQWGAVGLGAAAVAMLTATGDSFPWVAISLAATFAVYGVVKKVIPLAPTASLTAEGLVLFAPSLAYLIFLGATGTSTFTGYGVGHALLLIGTGILTCIPLVAFGAAARALPLSVLGLLQYMTPIMQFLLGVFWFQEAMTSARWIGFVLIWSALTIFTVDALRHGRRQRAVVRATARSASAPLSGG